MKFRSARPADSSAVVPLVYSSGPAFLDYIFCQHNVQQSQSFMHTAFTQGGGELGYRNHTVAELDGSVVGAGACFDSTDSFLFNLTGMRQIIQFYGLITGCQVIRRALGAATAVPPAAKNQLYIGHLGISPPCRGQGIGEALIMHLIQQHRSQHQAAVLDVSVENPRAQQLYQRMGFRVTALLRSSLRSPFATMPDHRRMEMPL